MANDTHESPTALLWLYLRPPYAEKEFATQDSTYYKAKVKGPKKGLVEARPWHAQELVAAGCSYRLEDQHQHVQDAVNAAKVPAPEEDEDAEAPAEPPVAAVAAPVVKTSVKGG